ncbi:MAG: TetR family transcriptional regulator [Myxococcota bacterium]
MARERRRIDTREKILEAAETQFARNGYAGAHLQSIAVEVGVQKTALYYYFPSKAALYIAVLSRMLESFERTATAAINRDESFRDRLGRLLDDLNDLLAERMNYSQILIRIYVDRTGVDLSALRPLISPWISAMLRFYKSGAEAGAFRKISARNTFSSVLGAIVFHYAAREFSAGILGVEDIFTHKAVSWRRQELRTLMLRGLLQEPDEPR